MNMHIQSESIWIESVIGSRKISNIIWALLLLIGATGFLLTGISSYLNKQIIPLFPQTIVFAPQGLIMSFYGIAGLFLSGYLWCIIFWNVGSGYNELDREKGMISIFRWGFPGTNRRIRIRFLLGDIQAVHLVISEGFRARSIISFRLKDQQYIPLIQIQESSTLQEIEERAAKLAQFLSLPIEGI
uniref:Photosystem I assembly protein Ycf4 n=1 Tax=Spirogyra maxima TaxID=3180 RepID=A0A191T4L6_SPIMX|nr:hypothetical chloroplast RF4 [Spirogyra maxima]ANI25335.1 hypothetical chloroplast RF4 [Spirogyra maxima]